MGIVSALSREKEPMKKAAIVAASLLASGGFATTAAPGNQFVQTILVANKASFHPQMPRITGRPEERPLPIRAAVWYVASGFSRISRRSA